MERRHTALLLAALLLGGAAWWMTRAEPPEAWPAGAAAQHEEPEAPAAPAATAAAHGAAATGSARDTEPARADTAPRRVRRSHDDATPARMLVRGRCIDADTGMPLAGVRVTLTAETLLEVALAERREPLVWRDPPPVVTDATGRFQFLLLTGSPLEYSFVVEREGWLAFVPPPCRAGQFARPFEIPLREIVPAVVRVVDTERQPVGAVLLEVELDSHVPRCGTRAVHATSRADGFALFEPGLPRGLHRATVIAGAAPAAGDVITGREERIPEIVVERAPVVLAGRVVDRSGLPARGVRVTARNFASIAPACTAATDEAGRFELRSAAIARTWHVAADRPLAAPPLDEREFPAGTRDLHLIVTDAGSIQLEVVDDATGEPVERFVVGLECTDRYGTLPQLPRRGHHANGRLLLADLPPGEVELEVHPADPALEITTGTMMVQAGAVVPLRIALRRAPVIRVRTHAGGVPVPDARVDLLGSWLGPPSARVTYDPPVPRGASHGYQSTSRVGRAYTDGEGRAELACKRGGMPLFVQVDAPEFVPCVVPVSLDAGGGAVEIGLSPGARLAVTLRPEGIARRLEAVCPGVPIVLELARLPSGSPEEYLGAFGVDACAFDRLEPGAFRLLLFVRGMLRWTSDGTRRGVATSHVLLERELELHAGVEAEVEFDLAECEPGTLELALLGEPGVGSLARQPIAMRPVLRRGSDGERGAVRSPGIAEAWTSVRLRTDDGGRLPPTALLPGTYELHVPASLLGSPSDAWVAVGGRAITVAPGARLHEVIQVGLRGAEVQLVTEDGRALRNVQFELLAPGRSEPERIRTDGDGRARWFGAGEITIEVDRSDNRLALRELPPQTGDLRGTLRIPDEPGMHACTVTLRPR